MGNNLGNVAGVVISSNSPLEADGITEKRYVLWAKPVGLAFDLRYFNRDIGDWTKLDASSIIDDTVEQSTTKTFSKTQILSLLSTSLKVTISGKIFGLSKKPSNIQSSLQVGDMITNGWWSATEFWYSAIYLGGEITDRESWNTINSLEDI